MEEGRRPLEILPFVCWRLVLEQLTEASDKWNFALAHPELWDCVKANQGQEGMRGLFEQVFPAFSYNFRGDPESLSAFVESIRHNEVHNFPTWREINIGTRYDASEDSDSDESSESGSDEGDEISEIDESDIVTHTATESLDELKKLPLAKMQGLNLRFNRIPGNFQTNLDSLKDFLSKQTKLEFRFASLTDAALDSLEFVWNVLICTPNLESLEIRGIKNTWQNLNRDFNSQIAAFWEQRQLPELPNLKYLRLSFHDTTGQSRSPSLAKFLQAYGNQLESLELYSSKLLLVPQMPKLENLWISLYSAEDLIYFWNLRAERLRKLYIRFPGKTNDIPAATLDLTLKQFPLMETYMEGRPKG